MAREKVLILCDSDGGRKELADAIAEYIRRQEGEYIRLGFEDLIFKEDTLLLDYDGADTNVILKKDRKEISLKKEIKSVLYLFQKIPSADKIKGLKEDESQFFSQEWQSFMQGIWLLLKDRLWMNPYPNYFVYQDKCYQLDLARRLGFKIPRTVIATSLKEAYERLKAINDQIIYKTFSQQFFKQEDKQGKESTYGIYTNIIEKEDLQKEEPAIKTPTIFQVYIPKKVEIRITVVGKTTFAAEIHSQQSQKSRIDWRRYDLKNTPCYKHNLPDDIKQKCVAMVENMGLTYSAIDMILTPGGDYVFLELNPSGLYGWLEHLAKLPITENIARMLLEGSVHYQARLE